MMDQGSDTGLLDRSLDAPQAQNKIIAPMQGWWRPTFGGLSDKGQTKMRGAPKRDDKS